MKKQSIAVIGPSLIQSKKFPQNPDPIQSMDGSNPGPTLRYSVLVLKMPLNHNQLINQS